VISSSDLYEREGTNQHAFCARLGREYPYDVRVLANVRPDAYWMDAMLHEFGHAVYDRHVNPRLPYLLRYLLRTYAHANTTEAIALMMGALVDDPGWLRSIAGANRERLDQDSDKLAAHRRADKMILTRFVLVMYHFERALYADPAGAELNTVWWDLVERLLFVDRPPGRDEPDWAAVIHVAVAPVYFHNYMLGELISVQLRNYLESHITQGPFYQNEVAGRYLLESFFGPGARENWRNTVLRHRRTTKSRALREVSRLKRFALQTAAADIRFSLERVGPGDDACHLDGSYVRKSWQAGVEIFAGRLLASPDRDLGTFEGAVVDASGPDFQGCFSRERRQVQGGFKVSPGMAPVIARDDSAHQNFSVRVEQSDGVRGFGVEGVAAYCEGVGDFGARAWLDQDRVSSLRRERRRQVSLRLEVDHEACGFSELDHPVEERLARKDVHEHATLWGAHDVEAVEHPFAEFSIRHARRAGRRQGYAQKAFVLLAREAPLWHGTGWLQAGPDVDDRPLVVLVNPIAHREHGVSVVAGTAARLRLRDERVAGGSVGNPGEITLDPRGTDGGGLGYVSRTRHTLFRGLCRTFRCGPGRSLQGMDLGTRIQAAGAEHGRQQRGQQEGGSPPHLPPASGHVPTSTYECSVIGAGHYRYVYLAICLKEC
jgi:hypothetical protein